VARLRTPESELETLDVSIGERGLQIPVSVFDAILVPLTNCDAQKSDLVPTPIERSANRHRKRVIMNYETSPPSTPAVYIAILRRLVGGYCLKSGCWRVLPTSALRVARHSSAPWHLKLIWRAQVAIVTEPSFASLARAGAMAPISDSVFFFSPCLFNPLWVFSSDKVVYR
jgi:hypothetical protein